MDADHVFINEGTVGKQNEQVNDQVLANHPHSPVIGLIGLNEAGLIAGAEDFFTHHYRAAYPSAAAIRLVSRTSYGFKERVHSRYFSGLIVRVRTPDDVVFVQQSECPVVTVLDRLDSGVPHVAMDNEEIGAVAATALHQAGCRSLVGFGLRRHQWSQERLHGFAERAARIGPQCELITNREALTDPYGSQSVSMRQQFYRLLRRQVPPIGLFGVDPAQAQNLAALVAEAPADLHDAAIGIAGVRQFSEVGIDDQRLFAITRPLHAVAMTAARLLAQMLHGEGVTGRTVVGGATVETPICYHSGLQASNDPIVQEFLRLCHECYHQELGIPDIVAMLGIHRRTLERACLLALKQSPAQLLRAIRLDYSEKLLVSTSLSIKSIAAQTGFASADRFGVCFRRRFGKSPGRYRSDR